MSRGGTSIAMQGQIKILYSQGKTIKSIARALDVSKNTVKKYIREHNGEKEKRIPDWAKPLDWEGIIRQFRKGATAQQLHKDFTDDEITYWTFNRYLRSLEKPSRPVALRLEHTPAERCQIDYAVGIPLHDPRTGEITKTWLFCGVLAFSSYTFGEFVANQTSGSFIKSQEKMWAYFGGVTPYVILDNLKSGVNKAHRFDPELNPTFCDYCNHMKVAPLPARPYTPRDKSAVESAISSIQKSFYQEFRNTRFYSLAELNSVFRRFLTDFNGRIMKDYGISREERFAMERERLLPLPLVPFETSSWKEAKVHPDCCIQVERNFYSVPYRHAGRSVKVRYSDTMVEVFSLEMELITTHIRLAGRGKSAIKDDHLPDDRYQMGRFEIKSCLAQAGIIGPKTLELVEKQFAGDRPFRRLRRVQGIMRLHKTHRFGKEAMEYAASQALTFQKFSLSFFRGCVESYAVARSQSKSQAPERDAATLYLHFSH